MIQITPFFLITCLFVVGVLPVLIGIGFVLWIKRKDIAAFFHPEDWFIGTILRDDGTEYTFLEKYPEEFYIKKGKALYFLTHRMYRKQWNSQIQESDTYEGRDGILPPGTKTIEEYVSPHRVGRLTAYYWQEGDPWPRDMRTGKAMVDAQLLFQLEKQKLNSMYDVPDQFNMSTIIIILLLLMVGAAVVYLILKKPDQAVQLASNATKVAGQVVVR